MEVSVTQIEREVNVVSAYGDSVIAERKFIETNLYRIGYIVLLDGDNTIEDYIDVRLDRDITFDEAKKIVTDKLYSGIR